MARQEESGWDPKPVCFVLTPLMILLLLLEQHANKGFSQPNICRYLHRGVYGNEISEALLKLLSGPIGSIFLGRFVIKRSLE